MAMWFLQSIFLCFLIKSITGDDEVTVTIPQGTLKGIKAFTVTQNIPYYSFRGVPFAKPRVGSTKFDQPESPEPWKGTWDATKHRAKCPAWCMVEKGVIGNEDCLYLNVYSTNLNSDAKKAVLVWFPTGGFNFGSGNDDLYGPDFFIDQDVILVTPNYRVGALGFLSTQDENAPGNAGMKDQSMALKWVQDNIAHFGGDPTKVTIFGHSSGSVSVQLHMMSPMSKGLFSRAVMQSGSAMCDWSLSRTPKEAAFKLGSLLGIKTRSTKDLVRELKKKSHVDIVTATKELDKETSSMTSIFTFLPVIEKDQGQNAFLSTDPWVAVKSSELADVPLMSGLVADEGVLLGMAMFGMGDALNKHLEGFIPSNLNITDAKMKKMIADGMKKMYFDDKKIAFPDTEAEFIEMVSDVSYNIPQLMATKIIQSRNKSPVFEYLFTYEAPFGVLKNLAGIDKFVAHGDETGYLFYSNGFNNKPEPNSPAEMMTHKMTKMWANFAREGNPTAKMDTDVNVQWMPLDKEDNYLNINLDLKMEKDLFTDRMAFWAEVYKDILGDYANVVK